MSNLRPTVALTLGDPAGIGPELIAKLLSKPSTLQQANIVLIGDPWVWEAGQQTAGVKVETLAIESLQQARALDSDRPLFVAVDSVKPEDVQVGVAAASGGASVLKVLDMCLAAVSQRHIDAICFAPLNKHAMKQAGMPFEDELHYFADYLKVDGFFCEFNTLGGLWTSRISSHVPLKDVASYLSVERIKQATRLIYQSLAAAGVAQPRVAVAAFNPHGGDGGVCGREEIDIIAPAVKALNDEGLPINGPFPADTIFLKARDGQYDAIVTMYHDQGQIAIKLLGFEKGVTVQGGLPVPITTPAHGTAYDIAGSNKASVQAMENAFAIACRMGASYRAQTRG
ncbi:4-hydroxythreonine-4-phosphate dehydrogenase [Pokkaliibacter plantistimulans]|uniref:4-hydroxythreonine-4-phosphate dehydrogenase n=1 Tax=Pokkaliibacter plantistimulans TaxID=1635171 RepID=A0ABX5LWQ6_9GAMM|nr:4-hydroxythreonine-4-phosphate dehydrogenase PdxA [Pokkaliibacter plantistimulans]PXF30065.1 4-hydroxythreonine-4-phosphate dehydrogenase [Pokkaliibacter plantistimulans]